MNAEMIQPRAKLIEIGKQYRGTWLLAGFDLLMVLALWAAVAYTPSASKPVTTVLSSHAQSGTAANAHSAPAQPLAVPLSRLEYVGPSHGAACNATPAGCGGNVKIGASDPPMACQPMSRAAQHRNGDLANPNPCELMR